MDINSQQQINTFVGGMNTDTSDAMLDSSQYRDALNLRIVTNTDSNSGELRVVEGTQSVIELDKNEEILKITGIRDYGILIVRNHVIQPDESYTWSIYRFKKDDPRQTLTRLFGPCSIPIWETESVNGVDVPKCTNLSVICNYESEENIKLYIADGIHEIMCINVYNTPSTVPYDFKYIRSYADNLFPKPNVQISLTRSGQVCAAKVLYYYRLYSKYGQATKLSLASSILSLYKDNATGYDGGAKSGRAIEINIPSISGVNFEYLQYIQIYRINYVTNGQAPEISLIIDLKYTESLHIIDEGSNDIEKISVSEFLSMIEFGIIPKNLEVKNNYLFASNLKYKQSEVDLKFKDLDLSHYFEILRGSSIVDDSYRLTDELLSSDYLNINATYRPGETYRFGVIFYDDEGNASSVFHLEDVTMPDYSEYNWINMSGLDSLSNTLLECLYEISPPAIKIRLKNETIPGCSKYEIVRCVRTLLDKRTISQGLLGRPLELFDQYDQSLNRLASSGFFSMGYFSMNTTSVSNDPTNTEDRSYDYAKSSESVLLFASPEYVYQPDDYKNIIEQYDNKLKICPVAEYASKIFDKENIDAVGYVGTVHAKYTNSLGSDTPHSYRLFYNDDPNSTNQIHPYNTIYADSLSIVYNDKNETDFEHIVNTQNGKTSYASYNTLYPSLKLYYITRIKNGPLYDEYFSFYTDKKYSVEDISYSDSPEWNQFATEDTIRCFDDVSYVGGWEYHNWSNIFLSGEAERLNSEGQKLEDYLSNIKNDNPTNYDKFRFPIGTGGECILLSISNQIDPMYSLGIPNSLRQYNAVNSEYGPFLITVADLRKDSVPYGGNSDYAKRHSVYYSYGDVFDNVLGDHKLTSGDCYIRMFKYNALHMWWDPIFSRVHKMSTIYCVPIFTDIDLHGEYGITFNRNLASGYKIQDKACKFDKYIQYKDAYLYNTAYNIEPTVVSHSAYDRDYIEQNLYDNRVHHSEQKTNNEIIDSWTKFKAMNFLDVDSRFGLITDTKLFKDKLIFWLEHAVGILAVNERVILQDLNETQVTLGTGAILDRYDYISTIYGMKEKQRTACISNDALYWWDGYNKEMLLYIEKYSVTPLSQIRNIRNYINNKELNDNPHVYSNRKYKEIIFQCVGNESITYNENIQRFTSRYTFVPRDSLYIEDKLFLVGQYKVYEPLDYTDLYSQLFENVTLPKLKWVINQNNTITKTYDILIISGNLYGGSIRVVDNDNPALFQNQPNVGGADLGHVYHTIDPLRPINIVYNTSLKLTGEIEGKDFTNREYDYRLNIPRESLHNVYGGRLRGKTMQCELSSNSNSTDFSLQYIITKYRTSWS